MGYTHAYYAFRLQTLKNVLERGDPYLRDRLEHDAARSRSAVGSEQEKQQWRTALKDLAGGALGRSLSANKPLGEGVVEATPTVSQAFVSLLTALGSPLGQITHSSVGGDRYRRRFLGLEAPSALKTDVDLMSLTGRPLFGLFHGDFPSWGALSVEEVQRVVADRTAEDLPYLEDSQSAVWLFNLWDMLAAAAESREDVVAVYT